MVMACSEEYPLFREGRRADRSTRPPFPPIVRYLRNRRMIRPFAELLCKQTVVNHNRRGRSDPHKPVELVPVKRFPLASPVHPFKENSKRQIGKVLNFFLVEGYTVISDVSRQFDSKSFPHFLQFLPYYDWPCTNL